jgi:hypothetical protein
MHRFMNKKRGVRRPGGRQVRKRRSRGAILVWFALMLTVLLGMVGLVVDVGLMMGTHRQVQNAADAAALAVAMNLLYGSNASPVDTATTYVRNHNGLADAETPVVHIPPASGAYVGVAGFVEVIVTSPVQTLFIQFLPGVGDTHNVTARAVAGGEAVTSGDGVAVLNPYVTGLTVGGQATLEVNGTVIDNSEGKGLDADGNPVGTGENYYAGRAGSNSPAYASKFHIVGGVDWPANFRNFDRDSVDKVLYCGQLPVPDPLLNLPTPTTNSGVVNISRGSPSSTNTNMSPGIDAGGENRVVTQFTSDDPDLFGGLPYLKLHPGIYTSIEITGGQVFFVPGIYVIKPAPNVQTAMKVTGGTVLAKGIMIYNTGHNYVPETGNPDATDKDLKPPHIDGAEFAAITLNSSIVMEPIDTKKYDYGGKKVSDFDGMLFYQRRRNTAGLDIQGNASEGHLAGTLYAKWAHVKLAGQGTYDAQFVVGSMEVTGSGVVTIKYAGTNLGKAPQIFLVE